MIFEDLPPEIINLIFSHLTQKDLHAVTKVSKRMRSLAFDPFLWKIVYLHKNIQTPDEISEILTQSSRARQISFTSFYNFSWMIKTIPKRQTVEDLNFYLCDFNEDLASHFVNLYPRVSSLIFFDCNINSRILRHFAQLEFLTSVDITSKDYDPFIDNECFILIAKECKNIEKLSMQGSKIYDSSFLTLVKLRGPQLKHLTMSCMYLSSVSFQSLRNCRRLKSLHLDCVTFMTENDEKVIKNLECLEDVELKYRESDDETDSETDEEVINGSFLRIY